jgi:hypothetical protein
MGVSERSIGGARDSAKSQGMFGEHLLASVAAYPPSQTARQKPHTSARPPEPQTKARQLNFASNTKKHIYHHLQCQW